MGLIDRDHRAKVEGRLGVKSDTFLKEGHRTDRILHSHVGLSKELIDLILIGSYVTIELTEADHLRIKLPSVGRHQRIVSEVRDRRIGGEFLAPYGQKQALRLKSRREGSRRLSILLAVEPEEPRLIHLRGILTHIVLDLLLILQHDTSRRGIGLTLDRVCTTPADEFIDDMAKHLRRITHTPWGRDLAELGLIEGMLYKALDIVGIGITLGLLMLFGELDEAADLRVVGFIAL